MSFNTEYTITRDTSSIIISITSGEIFAWEATNTRLDTVNSGNFFIIGADLIENGIQLDFTNSINPSVTGGTIRSDYINTILGLVNDARSSDVGITTNSGGIEIFGGITSATTLDVNVISGAIGVTGTAGAEGLLNAEIGATSVVSYNRITNDWRLDLSNGLLEDKYCFNFLAYDDEIGTSSSDIGDGSSGIGFNWFETADTVDVVSTQVDDGISGSRARTIVIEGLDATFTGITESISLNGKTPVTSSNSYIRINRTYVESSGTYHYTNRGDITLTRNTGGLKYTTIKGDIGTSRMGAYTVPVGKTAFITNIQTSINTKRRGKISIYKLENADDTSVPVSAQEVVWNSAHTSGVNNTPCYIKIPEKSDFWVRGSTDFNKADFSVVMAIYVVDN